MTLRVVVRPPALEDIAESATWYENQCPGLGLELTDEVINAIHRPRENPNLFRIIRSRDGIRRVLTERFPFRVFFSINRDVLYVHAVLHGARSDRHWRGRP